MAAPYEAGLRNWVNGAGCTSNFAVTNPVYGNFGMTGGHCGGNGSRVVHGTTTVGTVSGNAYFANNPTISDSSAYPIAANITNRYRGVNLHRTVSGKYNNADS